MVSTEPSVFLFIGGEKHLKEKAIGELSLSLFGSTSKDLDYKTFYGNEANAREILDCVTTLPFLASKRFVVIKDFEKLSRDDRLRIAEYIKKPYKSTCLVIDTESDSVLKDVPDIPASVKVKRFDPLSGSQIPLWIKDFVSSRDKKIEQGAVEELSELGGDNMFLISQELEKLITFIGARDEISLDDVYKMVGRPLARSAFEIVDAISVKNVDDAVRAAGDITMGGRKAYEVIGLLCWHFKRILKAKSLERGGMSDYAISGILRIRKSDSKVFFNQMKSLTVSDIESKMKILLEADLDIKNTKFNPSLILEIALVRLCLG